MIVIDNSIIDENNLRVTYSEKSELYIAYFRLNKDAMNALGNPSRIDYGVDGNKIYFIPNEKGLIKVFSKSKQVSATKLLKVLGTDIFPQCYVMQRDDKGYFIEVDLI